MRRRRQEAVTWLPTLGQFPEAADPLSGISFNLTIPLSGITTVTGVLPLTFDYPTEATAANTDAPLGDIIGNEYILKRLVGKVFVALDSGSATSSPAVLVGVGFLVARADAETGPNGSNSPIGLITAQDENYGVLHPDVIRDPWIWRRTWILGNASADSFAFSRFPGTNVGYGSVADGPHIDSKVKRRVTQDDRLWVSISARRFPLTAGSDGFTSVVTGYLDYRILGSLRKPRNRGAF